MTPASIRRQSRSHGVARLSLSPSGLSPAWLNIAVSFTEFPSGDRVTPPGQGSGRPIARRGRAAPGPRVNGLAAPAPDRSPGSVHTARPAGARGAARCTHERSVHLRSPVAGDDATVSPRLRRPARGTRRRPDQGSLPPAPPPRRAHTGRDAPGAVRQQRSRPCSPGMRAFDARLTFTPGDHSERAPTTLIVVSCRRCGCFSRSVQGSWRLAPYGSAGRFSVWLDNEWPAAGVSPRRGSKRDRPPDA